MATEDLWDHDILRPYLEGASKLFPPARIKLEDFNDASHQFSIKFPIDTARVKTHVKQGKNPQTLTNHINSAYPIIHERCIPLLATFIHHKKHHGSTKEKTLYQKIDLASFVNRLLYKRPVTFFHKYDQYLLRDGSTGKGGFERIGSDAETPQLCLDEYLSYDEMKVSALLSVSSESYFINDGSRKNKGLPGEKGTFQEGGVIIGMVGARLKKAGYMEWQDCIVEKTQNIKANGYGSLDGTPLLQHVWSCLWGELLPEWHKHIESSDQFLQIDKNNYFNVEVYKKRMQLSAETFLAEAKSRAVSKDMKAYIHVVGLGLGVWRACHDQDKMFTDAWGEALKVMDTSTIAHVDFSWIGADTCLGTKDGEVFPGTEVVIHFSKRSLHDPVPTGTLLVVNYAWDGNALPGNEYWLGKLCSTGDGAAASSSGVAELHNPYINTNVCGDNLHVAGRWGVLHIGEYAKKSLSRFSQDSHSSKKKKCF
ncbi:hypothetical protein SK128_001477 [Halocaridina rubra]|uniref:Uncharacterized protein n=1 Tax=Halocaridina rubra TaxID=373956 RepID=A0AAN8XCX9_HALRR